jgi:hypothetical protein
MCNAVLGHRPAEVQKRDACALSRVHLAGHAIDDRVRIGTCGVERLADGGTYRGGGGGKWDYSVCIY